MLSLLFSFWAMLGLKDGLNHLKSRIFLQTVPGLGITRKGIPIGYLGIFYSFIEFYLAYYGKKNSEVVLAQIVTGIIFGLVVKRYRPILKWVIFYYKLFLSEYIVILILSMRLLLNPSAFFSLELRKAIPRRLLDRQKKRPQIFSH